MNCYSGRNLGVKGTAKAELERERLVDEGGGRHIMEIAHMLPKGPNGKRKIERRYIDGDHADAMENGALRINSAYMTKQNKKTGQWSTNEAIQKLKFKDTGTIVVKEGAYVHKGEELLMSYGPAYWRTFDTSKKGDRELSCAWGGERSVLKCHEAYLGLGLVALTAVLLC